MKLKTFILNSSKLNEASRAMPGEWVVFLEYPKSGKKLVKVAKNHRGASMIMKKLERSWPDGVDGIGMMPKNDWDTNEAPWAIK